MTRAGVGGMRGRRRSFADGQAASVDVEAGDAVDHALRRQVDGEVAAQRVAERRQAWRRHQHRMNGQPLSDEPSHHPFALGDEAAPPRR